MPLKIMLLLLVIVPGFVACASVPADVNKSSDVRYGPHARNVLDIYTDNTHDDPVSNRTHSLKPVIFMVHGGAWVTGEKDMRRVVVNKVRHWLPQGYVFISSNYRLAPEVNPVQQVQDIANAIAYAQKNAATWGADPNKFILMGHSAGAHLVSLVAASPEYAHAAGMKPLRGSILLDTGGLDIVQIMQRDHYGFYDIAFGSDIEFWKKTSPVYTLRRGAQPMLLVCSSRRKDNPCSEAQKFAARAATLNVHVEVLPQDLTHAGVNARLGEPGAYTDAVDAFMQKVL